jgi:hypothetical protein
MKKYTIALTIVGLVIHAYTMDYTPLARDEHTHALAGPADEPADIYAAIAQHNNEALAHFIAEGQTNRGTLIHIGRILPAVNIQQYKPQELPVVEDEPIITDALIQAERFMCCACNSYTNKIVTPFYYALKKRNLHAAALLLEAGAELRTGLFEHHYSCLSNQRVLKDSSARLLAYIAVEEESPEAVALLRTAITKRRSFKVSCRFVLHGKEYHGSIVTLPEALRQQAQFQSSLQDAFPNLIINIHLAGLLHALGDDLCTEIEENQCFPAKTFLTHMLRAPTPAGCYFSSVIRELCTHYLAQQVPSETDKKNK